MEGLEDAWPRLCYFLHTHGHSKSTIFEHRKHLTFFISSVLIKNVSAT